MSENEPILMTFGMVTDRTDADYIEELQDALDDLLEDEWDIVAWKRSSGIRCIVRATLECRSISQSEPSLKVDVVPVGELLEDYKDSRNKWLIPSNPREMTPFDRARQLVEDWITNMWPNDISEPPKENVVESEQRPQISIVKDNAKNKILDAFNLSGTETSQSGNKFNMYTYKELNKEQDDSE